MSAPAAAGPSASLADLASSSFSGTTNAGSINGCSFSQEFDASYAGNPNVGTVALHVAGCLHNNPDSSGYVVSGSFTMNTNVGTLGGTTSGSAKWENPLHTALGFQLSLSVQSATGSFAGTTGNLQFGAGVGCCGTTFGGAVFALSAFVARPSNGATVSGSTILDASATTGTAVSFWLFGDVYGYAAPLLCTATLTAYGWVCSWNSATSPNGSYVLVAEASNSTSTALSPNVNITIKN